MSPAVLLLIALGGVALLLLLVLKFKFHPFVALLSVSNCSSTPCRCALPCSSCTPSCPRTPGPVAVAGPFGADIGRILLCGLPVTALVTLVGYFIANRMTKNAYPMSDDVRVEVYGPDVTDEDIREWTVNPESAQTGSPSGHFNPAGGHNTGLSAAEEVGSVDVLTAPLRRPRQPTELCTRAACSSLQS